MTLIAMNPIQMLTRSVSRVTSLKAGLTLVAVMCATASFGQGESGANNDLSTFVDPGASGANVDKATGAFSFSMPLMTLPGAAGEGYPIVLGYAPPSPDEPASWVGYGWSLGPGAVNRSVNGIPDDFNGIDITNISKTPVHHKITLNSTAGFEVFSNSTLGLTKGIAWDSERGILPSFSLSLNGFGAGLSYMQEAVHYVLCTGTMDDVLDTLCSGTTYSVLYFFLHTMSCILRTTCAVCHILHTIYYVLSTEYPTLHTAYCTVYCI